MFFIRSRQGYIARSLGVAITALALVGCGGSSKSSATASLQWSLFDLSDSAMSQPLRCADVGAGAVVLSMQDSSAGTTYTKTFKCLDYAGASDVVPAGTYDVTVTLYGDPTIYGNTTTVLDTPPTTGAVLVAGPNALLLTDFLVNSFVLGWSISSGGYSTTCASAGAASVELDVWFPGQTTPTAYSLPCDSTAVYGAGYRAATMAIPMGPYNVTWQAFLVDAQGTDVAPGTTTQPYPVSAGAQADLGSVIFSL